MRIANAPCIVRFMMQILLAKQNVYHLIRHCGTVSYLRILLRRSMIIYLSTHLEASSKASRDRN